MYVNESIFKRKVRGLVWRIFNFFENNGNAVFERNGEEVFIDTLFKAFKQKDGIKIIFDVGANIGHYSTMLIDKGKELGVDFELHIFEPTQSCFKLLTDTFNGHENIILNPFGVSHVDETTDIFYDKERSGLASLYQRNLDSYCLELNQREKIQVRRLDDYIQEHSINHIDFIKIDIEGHELRGFEGIGKYCDSEFIDFIQFEYGGANLDSHTSLMEIYKFLDARGFNVAKVMRHGLEMRQYRPNMENFNYANYVAISKKVMLR